jgi:transposase InsO family protein
MIRAAHAAHPEQSIRQLCALLGVGRTWYYTHPAPDETASHDVVPRAAIEELVLVFPGYGYRRVTRQLQRDGWQVNHKRVLRVMREEALLCQLKRHFVMTTDANHGLRRYPNLIADRVVTQPDQIWQADITYIRLPAGFVYLACVLDSYSRRCVGWALSRTIDTELTLAALAMALTTRQPAPGLIHHSDQGVQYASAAYVARLEEVGVQSSMAAAGNPYENAKAESFFKTLKVEEVYLNDYRSYQEAQANLMHFIEEVYNRKRLHSSLGYLPPDEFEEAYRLAAD